MWIGLNNGVLPALIKVEHTYCLLINKWIRRQYKSVRFLETRISCRL